MLAPVHGALVMGTNEIGKTALVNAIIQDMEPEINKVSYFVGEVQRTVFVIY